MVLVVDSSFCDVFNKVSFKFYIFVLEIAIKFLYLVQLFLAKFYLGHRQTFISIFWYQSDPLHTGRLWQPIRLTYIGSTPVRFG